MKLYKIQFVLYNEWRHAIVMAEKETLAVKAFLAVWASGVTPTVKTVELYNSVVVLID